MKKQTVAFPVMPAVPWGTEERCITLEAGFARQLLGLCGVLTLYRMWDGTDEEIALVQAQVEKGIAALMGCGCFEGVLSVASTRSGYTRVINADGSVTLLGEKSLEDITAGFPTTQNPSNASGNICAGTRGMVERILEDLLFSIQQAEFAILELKLVVETAASLAAVVTFFTGVQVEGIIDTWGEWILEAGDVGIGALKLAISDPDVRDKMVENIYCGIRESGSNQLTATIYNNAMDDLPILESQSTLLAQIFRGLETTVSTDSYLMALRFYNLYALNSDNTCEAAFECDDPVEWCIILDFTLFEYASIVSGADKLYVAGSGYRTIDSLNSGTWSRIVQMVIDIPGVYDITRIEMIGDRTLGPSSQTAFWRIIAGGTDAQNNGATGSNVNVVMATAKTDLDNFYVANRVSSSTNPASLSGVGWIKKIKITGTGPRPEGYPDCP